MNKVERIVRLHPETVTNYRSHIPKRAYAPSSAGDVQHLRVNLKVWRTAIKLAGGDASRIAARSESEVVVLNHPIARRLSHLVISDSVSEAGQHTSEGDEVA